MESSWQNWEFLTTEKEKQIFFQALFWETVMSKGMIYPLFNISVSLPSYAMQLHVLKRKINCYLSTTTIGLSLPVMTINPFQIISAEETIIPKFRTW